MRRLSKEKEEAAVFKEMLAFAYSITVKAFFFIAINITDLTSICAKHLYTPVYLESKVLGPYIKTTPFRNIRATRLRSYSYT